MELRSWFISIRMRIHKSWDRVDQRMPDKVPSCPSDGKQMEPVFISRWKLFSWEMVSFARLEFPQALFPQDDGPLSVWLNSQVMSLASIISQRCCFVKIGHLWTVINGFKRCRVHRLKKRARFTFSQHSVKLAAEVVGFSSASSCLASKHGSGDWLSPTTWRIALWNLSRALEAEFRFISRVNQPSDTKRTNNFLCVFSLFSVCYLPPMRRKLPRAVSGCQET